jgi:hypothetical protein
MISRNAYLLQEALANLIQQFTQLLSCYLDITIADR